MIDEIGNVVGVVCIITQFVLTYVLVVVIALYYTLMGIDRRKKK